VASLVHSGVSRGTARAPRDVAPSAALYDVLFGGGFVLDAGGPETEKHLSWNFPQDFVFGTKTAKPMLAFMLVPLGKVAVRFKVFVNHREILSWGPIAPGTAHGLWAPFSAALAFPDGSTIPEQVPVRVLASDGRMRFENVVMWSRVRI
jgi:hypothetical protein